MFFSEYLKITKINISGTEKLEDLEIQQALDARFEGKFLEIIPKNNFLFFSSKRVENILTDKFKKIRTANVAKKFPNTISILIDERKALLVWCAGEKCFLIDENGVAYNSADFNSPEISQNNLIKIEDASGQNISMGEKIINSSYEQYVIAIKDELNKFDFEAEGYYTPSRVAEEIDVRTKQETEIYLSTQFPLESAMRTLRIVLEKEISRDKKENLAYIDLRSENKVFYKFKDQKQEEENKTETEK